MDLPHHSQELQAELAPTLKVGARWESSRVELLRSRSTQERGLRLQPKPSIVRTFHLMLNWHWAGAPCVLCGSVFLTLLQAAGQHIAANRAREQVFSECHEISFMVRRWAA